MTTIVATVQSLTWAAPEVALVPSCTWSGFRVFHWTHRHLWPWFRKAEVYANTDNFHRLVAGQGLEFIAGNNKVLQIAAHCVLIVHRILHSIQQAADVADAYHSLGHAICNRYPVINKIEFVSNNCFFSPSTYVWLKTGWSSFIRIIVRIAKALFYLIAQLFLLSMRMMDAIESFKWNENKVKESIRELFVNLTASSRMMVSGLEFILEQLEDPENKASLDQMLAGLGSVYKIDQIIEVVRSTLEKAQTVKGVINAGDGLVKNGVQEMFWQGFAAVNMQVYVPEMLTPGATNEEQEQTTFLFKKV